MAGDSPTVHPFKLSECLPRASTPTNSSSGHQTGPVTQEGPCDASSVHPLTQTAIFPLPRHLSGVQAFCAPLRTQAFVVFRLITCKRMVGLVGLLRPHQCKVVHLGSNLGVGKQGTEHHHHTGHRRAMPGILKHTNQVQEEAIIRITSRC